MHDVVMRYNVGVWVSLMGCRVSEVVITRA